MFNLDRRTAKLTAFKPDNIRQLLVVDPEKDVHQFWVTCADRVQSALRLIHARSLAKASQILMRHPSSVIVVSERIGLEEAVNFMSDVRTGDPSTAFCWVGSQRFDDAMAASLGIVAQQSSLHGESLLVEGLLTRLGVMDAGVPNLMGALETLEFFDFLQMHAQGRRTAAMRFTITNDKGLIVFTEGRIHSAETNELVGMDALVEISLWKEGTYKEVCADPLPEANLEGAASAVLMQLAKAKDERDQRGGASRQA